VAHFAVCVLLFLAPDIYFQRRQTNDTLRVDRDIHAWISSVGESVRTGPVASGFVYEGLPRGFEAFGAQATLRYFLHRLEVPMAPASSPEAASLLQAGNVAILSWNQSTHSLKIERPRQPEQ